MEVSNKTALSCCQKRVSSPTRIQAYLPKDTNNKKNSHQWKENKDLVVVGRYFEPQVTR